MSVDPTRYNRLLDYRTREALVRMSDAERIALFEEIVSRGPSRQAWAAVYELFDLWPDSAEKERQIDAACVALAAWDDRVREQPSEIATLYRGDRLSPLARLVRSIEMRRRDSGARELHAIATSPEAAQLKRLAIHRSEIGHAWQDLIAAPYLTNLEHLHVSDTGASDDELRRFLTSANLPSLRALGFTSMRVTPQVLRAIAHAIAFPALDALDLSGNYVRDEGADILGHAPWLARIEKLAIARNQVSGAGVIALLASPHVLRLRALDASGNRIAAADASAINARAQQLGIALTL